MVASLRTDLGSEYVERRNLNRISPWQGRHPLLEQLDIELTERCNNNCIHCSINLPESDKNAIERELTTAEWKRILKEAAEIGVLTVRFTGGEPLLRDDFEELYTYARNLGLKVLLFTNARLITSRLADLFQSIPPLEKIEVSVYGMRKKSYDAVSGVPGSFAEFRAGVQNLLERNIPFIVKGALLPENKDEIQEFERWAETIPWMTGAPTYAMFYDLRGRRDSLRKNRRIMQLRVGPVEGIGVVSRNPEKYRKEMAQFCCCFMGVSGPHLFTCGAGVSISIDAYGYIQPCLSLRAPEFCHDVKKVTLTEVLTVIYPRMRRREATNPEYLNRCASCFIKGLCEQCPAKSWSEHGTLDTPVEYLCAVAHAQARYLGLLQPGENSWKVQNGDERVRDLLKDSPA